jgi:uncharacterized protein YndB with AHSA1/START domain
MTMTDVSVRNSVTVDAPIERAFEVFTAGIASWWPAEHHLLQAELAEMTFEPRVGGRIIDRGVDGSECPWSRVLAYDPPQRVVFTWDINPQFQLEPDPAKASEVEVRFHAEGPGRTRVDLEHRHLDRHGDGWEGLRDALGSPDGWPHELEAFAQAARP